MLLMIAHRCRFVKRSGDICLAGIYGFGLDVCQKEHVGVIVAIENLPVQGDDSHMRGAIREHGIGRSHQLIEGHTADGSCHFQNVFGGIFVAPLDVQLPPEGDDRAQGVGAVSVQFVLPSGDLNKLEHGFRQVFAPDADELFHAGYVLQVRHVEFSGLEQEHAVAVAEVLQRHGHLFFDGQLGSQHISGGQPLIVFILGIEHFCFLFRRQILEDTAREGCDSLLQGGSEPVLAVDDQEGSVFLPAHGEGVALIDIEVFGDLQIVVGQVSLDGGVYVQQGQGQVFIVDAADFGDVCHDGIGQSGVIDGGGVGLVDFGIVDHMVDDSGHGYVSFVM